jgi:hypothetical protein
MARLQRLPERFLAIALVKRNYAERGPELVQRTQHGGLGQLLAELFLDFSGRQDSALLQQLPDMGDEGRDAIRSGGARRMFPVAVAAQRINERQRFHADQKVGIVRGCAEQVQRECGVGLNQPD